MRSLAIIWAFFYLFSAVGYGAEVHYCLGQVSDVSYIWFDASCVCDASEVHSAKPMNCCEDERFFVQLEDDHQSSTVNLLVYNHPFTTISFKELRSDAVTVIRDLSISDRAPPSSKERVIELQQLVFYA